MSTTHHHRRSRWRRRLNTSFALACGVALFSYCAFRGIDKDDPWYGTKFAAAWGIAMLGGYSSYRAFYGARRTQRVMAIIAFTLIIASVGVMTFLIRSPDPTAAPPPSHDFTE